MSITTPAGFVASGLASGIKASGALDLALVATDDGVAVPAAATFTSNLAAAAPVQVSRDHLAASGGWASAIVVSSGNANAATGAQGRANAEAMCMLVSRELGVPVEQVLVCSTGLIGIPLPMDPITRGIPELVASRAATEEAARDAASGILRSPSPAWPKGPACWHRTWPPCWRSSPPTPPSSPALWPNSCGSPSGTPSTR
jgi:glutamate N-acetyltransferase/amino-acid N-acetyltransferase